MPFAALSLLFYSTVLHLLCSLELRSPDLEPRAANVCAPLTARLRRLAPGASLHRTGRPFTLVSMHSVTCVRCRLKLIGVWGGMPPGTAYVTLGRNLVGGMAMPPGGIRLRSWFAVGLLLVGRLVRSWFAVGL